MSFFTFLIAFSCTFQFVQLLLEMLKETSTIQSIIPNWLWFSHYPVNVTVLLIFLRHKDELLSYFEEWIVVEREIYHQPNSIIRSYRRVYRNVYANYLFQSVGLTVIVGIVALENLDASYLLSYYPIFRDTLTIPVILTYHLITMSIGCVQFALADLVPAWTFYHSGIMLESLAFQIESSYSSKNLNFIMKTSQLRFKKVCRMTERANRLFGCLTVVDHLSTLFMTCVLSYTVLSRMSRADLDVVFYFMSLIGFIGRLMIPILMTSHLRTGFNRLKKAVVEVLSFDISPEKLHQAKTFLTQIKESQTAARPLNLYDITPSTLLSFASLTVGYVIVLLQSK